MGILSPNLWDSMALFFMYLTITPDGWMPSTVGYSSAMSQLYLDDLFLMGAERTGQWLILETVQTCRENIIVN